MTDRFEIGRSPLNSSAFALSLATVITLKTCSAMEAHCWWKLAMAEL
jgi:hypothetical protein